MNVQKMRHQLRRACEAQERASEAAWLAAITPEHRALHERRPPPTICGACLNAAMAQMGESLRAMTQRADAMRAARLAAAEKDTGTVEERVVIEVPDRCDRPG